MEKDEKSLIKTVSIPKWMYDEVKRRHLSMSSILQEALQKIFNDYEEKREPLE